MANGCELTIDVDAPPDTVLAVAGDVAGVPGWFDKYPHCEVDADIRTLRNAEGGEMVERLLNRDDAERRYSYAVIAGPPLTSHWAEFHVVPRDVGRTIRWATKAVFRDESIDPRPALPPPGCRPWKDSRPCARARRPDSAIPRGPVSGAAERHVISHPLRSGGDGPHSGPTWLARGGGPFLKERLGTGCEAYVRSAHTGAGYRLEA